MDNHSHFDAIVIGAGHNGLVAANYLAMEGMRVCVLEQRPIVGGAAVTEEFHPGYRNSIASYVVSLLRQEVIDELELKRFGYSVTRLTSSFYPDSNGDYLLLTDDEHHNRREIAKFSNSDYEALQRFHAITDLIGDFIARQWLRDPLRLSGGGLNDLVKKFKLGLDLRHFDDDSRHRLLQFFFGAPETIIERWFESDKVKAMIASHCLPANYASLHQPGSGLAMLHHAVGQVDGHKGAWGLVKGGMGGITKALSSAAVEKGVVIRTGVTVERILTDGNAVCGAQIQDGEIIPAGIIAANTDPKRTFLTLLGEDKLPRSFAKDIKVFRQESASLRMNLALSDLPEFACIQERGVGVHHRGSIMMIESKDHVERAYRSSRAGLPADPPIIDALIPSTLDDSLTDQPGTHVMSLLCKYMPYDLSDGKCWDDEKDGTVQNILRYLTKFIPNLPEILVGCQCLTPLDLERMFGMTRGDISHGRLEPDQIFSVRPHPKAAQYATPVKGLYLCGSGAHPGGGVTGAPGRNAAKRILKDLN